MVKYNKKDDSQKSFKLPKKKIITKNANDLTGEANKFVNEKINEVNETKLKTYSKSVNNERNTVEEESRKLPESSPLELMNRLEQFSSVWNDCPDIKQSAFVVNHVAENDLYVNDLTKSNANKPKSSYKVRDYFQLPEGDTKINYEQNTWNKNINDKPFNNKNSSDKLCTTEPVENNNISTLKENNKKYQTTTDFEQTSSNLADLKRKKAVNEQRQLHVDQRKAIKQALSALDGRRVNKKVFFSDDTDCEDNQHRKNNYVAPKVDGRNERLQLFQENYDNEVEERFNVNTQFEGKKGQKLLELQSKYASDSRFTLDTRFCESDSEGSENEIPENENHTNEKEKQLAILGSIVNRQIRPLSEIKQSSTKKRDHKWMVRFDPTRADHSKYLLKPKETRSDDTADTVKKKKKEANKPENKVQVSDKKFYSVKDDLKEVLVTENKTEFSLLKLFGPKESSESNPETEATQKLKKPKYSGKNPFKYDSSDSEHEGEKLPISKESKNKSSIKQPSTTTWRTTFFFTENDSRLQEALEFLKAPEVQEDNREFTEKRKTLKDFIKNKFKNNSRKNGLFKKKLGGLKRKPFFKKKSRSS